MKLVLLGPPGAGKGSVSELAIKRYKFTHISTGNLFRAEVKAETALGNTIKAIMEKGALVPDDLTIQLLTKKMLGLQNEAGWILDGYPRTIVQAQALEGIAVPDLAVNLELDNEQIVLRLAGRRQCPTCGKLYHITNMPPLKEGICDVDGGILYTRKDDNPIAIQVRLDSYRKQTTPLLQWYGNKKILKNIDARGDIHEVMALFEKAIA